MRITSWSDTLWHCNRSITCRRTIDCMNNHQRVRHMKYLESWRKGSFGWCGIRHGELIFVACPVCKLHVADARRKMMLMYVSIGWQKKYYDHNMYAHKKNRFTYTNASTRYVDGMIIVSRRPGRPCLPAQPSKKHHIRYSLITSRKLKQKSWNAGLIQTYRHWIMNNILDTHIHHHAKAPMHNHRGIYHYRKP